MPNLRFTQEAIDALKPPPKGRILLWDSATPGFGLRISSTGKKTWVAQYRVKGTGRPITETLGSFSDIPTVKQAREKAQKSRVKAKDGIDPTAERRAQKEEQKQEQQNRVTFAEIFDRYLREYCSRNLRPSTLKETQRMLEHDILPHWGKRALIDITRKDIQKLMDDKASTRDRPRKGTTAGSGIMANRNLTKLRTFFGWCVKKELIPTNPATAVDKPVMKEETRERILNDKEIVALWHATDLIGYPYQHITKLLLLTGQRRSEVGGMRWSEIDLEKSVWTIPRERAKNNKTHIVQLSPLALDIMNSVAHLKSDLLFPARSGKPVEGFNWVKPRLDDKFSIILGQKVMHWTFHDLRRTCASGMAELGIAPHVLDRVLNHTAGTIRGVALIYNRFQYLDERRAALDAWADHVEKLVTKKVKRVVM